jgi:hypothetical protein
MEETKLLISICAFIVSFCALGLSVWQAYIGRRHNRLSVRPHLQIHHSIEKNRRIMMLKNCGIGPAILTKMELLTPLPIIANLKNWEHYLKSIGFVGHMETYYIQGEVDVLSAGQEKCILKLNITDLPEQSLQAVHDKLNTLQIRFDCKSMYNQKFPYTSSKVSDQNIFG